MNNKPISVPSPKPPTKEELEKFLASGGRLDKCPTGFARGLENTNNRHTMRSKDKFKRKGTNQ